MVVSACGWLLLEFQEIHVNNGKMRLESYRGYARPVAGSHGQILDYLTNTHISGVLCHVRLKRRCDKAPWDPTSDSFRKQKTLRDSGKASAKKAVADCHANSQELFTEMSDPELQTIFLLTYRSMVWEFMYYGFDVF